MAVHKKTRLLIVEDHHLMRQGLASLLASQGEVEVVGEAANGLEALAQAEAVQPDVVLMDLSMPTMSGLEATRQLKERHPRLPVLILSMYNDPVFVTRALRAGAAGYILKESMVEELTLALRSVAEGGLFLSPLVAAPIVQEYLAHSRTPVEDSYEQLTPREREVLHLLAEGCSAPEIAQTLVVSQATVQSHLASLKQKLGLRKKAELIRYAVEHGLIPRQTPPGATDS